MQLSFLALTGRNADAALKMPSAMLTMLCEQLGIHSTAIASLKSLYSNADRTISNHRAWVREQLLFSTYDSNAEARLQAALSQQAIDASCVDDLLACAQEWLFDNRIVLPGQRVVLDLARSAFQVVENLALATIRAAVTPVRLRAVLKVMHEESPTPGISLLEWLKQSAGKHGVKGLKEVNSRIDALKTLGDEASKPLVVRLDGNNVEEGRRILAEAGAAPADADEIGALLAQALPAHYAWVARLMAHFDAQERQDHQHNRSLGRSQTC